MIASSGGGLGSPDRDPPTAKHQRVPRRSLETWAPVAVGGLAAALGVIAVVITPSLSASGPTTWFWLACVLAVATALLAPNRLVPGLILVLYVLTPVKYLPFPADPGALGPGLIGVAVWCARLLIVQRPALTGVLYDRRLRAALLMMGSLGILLIAESAIAFVRPGPVISSRTWSLLWTANFVVVALMLAVAVAVDRGAARYVLSIWEFAVVGLVLYGVFEALLWQANPIFDQIYQGAKPPLTQVWDTYRVTTSLGHPLVNGMFFAGAGAIAFGRLASSRQPLHLAPAFASLLGIVLTASRGSIAALAAAVAMIALVAGLHRAISRPAAVAIVVTVVLAVMVIVAGLASNLPLLERFGSLEAQSSATVRSSVITQGFQLSLPKLAYGWGPGTADAVFSTFVSGGAISSLEDGWIEMLVDTGLPGFALIVALVAACLLHAARTGNVEGAGLLVAVGVAIAGFNFFDGEWPAMIMLGVAIGSALTDPLRDQLRNSMAEESEYALPAPLGHASHGLNMPGYLSDKSS